MNHIPDISITSSDLVPTVVREEMMPLCLGREGDWGQRGFSKLICHACVLEPDP